MLRLHNTLTGAEEELRTIEEGVVRLYTCGPTVYDYAHIGNFRTFVFQDLLRRYLAYRSYRVMHVMNITDVDDRIIQNAREQGMSLKDYTEKYTEAFFEDSRTLQIELPELMPRATDHIPEMVALIKQLEAKGYTYRKDGSIYFSISRFAGLREAEQGGFQRHPARRSGRHRQVRQGERARLRALEGAEGRRGFLGDRNRSRKARLAHRVLGDEHEVSGRDIRHSLRRRRPGLSPS